VAHLGQDDSGINRAQSKLRALDICRRRNYDPTATDYEFNEEDPWAKHF
jgi:hypothetical protein